MPPRDPWTPPHGCRCGAHQITPACPVDCLRAVMPAAAFNSLARASGAPFSPPATAGDIAALHQQDQLSQIRGLGTRRHREITHGLQLAGLIAAASPPGPDALAARPPQPALENHPRKDPARQPPLHPSGEIRCRTDPR